MKRTRALVCGVAGVVALAAGCNKREEPTVTTSTTSAKLIQTGPGAAAVNFGLNGQGEFGQSSTSPSAVFAPGVQTGGNKLPGLLVSAFDDTKNVGVLSAWAFSDDGTNFTVCRVDEAGCNGGTDLQTQVNSALKSSGPLFGRPALAAEGLVDGNGNSRVVMAMLRDADSDKIADQVIVAFSTDTGRTFTITSESLASFKKGGPPSQRSCDAGSMENPHASFDMTTAPPTLWIVWRKDNDLCVRHGTFDSMGNFSWRAPTGAPAKETGARTVGNVDVDNGHLGAGMAQAGYGALTVVYQSSDPELPVAMSPPTDLRWKSVTTFNDGRDWAPSVLIHHTTSFAGQTLPGRMPGPVRNSSRAFGFIRTPAGNYFVAVNDTQQSIRLFHSGNYGQTWREQCGGLGGWQNAGDCPPAAPTINYTVHATASVILPTLASDGDNRLAFAYYESQAPIAGGAHATVAPVVRVAVQPLSQKFPFFEPQLGLPNGSPLAPAFAVPPLVAPHKEPIGRLMSIAVRSNMVGVRRNCEGNGVFYPFWTSVSNLGLGVNIHDTALAFTP